MKRILQFCSFFLHFLLISGVAIPTQHVDIGRTGSNTLEYALTPTNVVVGKFGKLFTVTLDSPVAGQPLYVQNVLINGTTLFNVVYVYTNNGKVDNSPSSVIAIDADRGTILWQSVLKLNAISMTASPTIDLANNIIFVVSKDTNSTGNALLWAIDLRNGTKLPGSPAIVTATVVGSGLDAVNGQIAFGPAHEDARGALLFVNGVLYVGFGGGLPGFHRSPYHGWLFSYTYNTAVGFTQQNVWISTPASTAGGVWQAGKGFSSDGTNIFVSTGFGTFNLQTNDMAMSFIKFDPNLAVLDFFTPAQEASFSANQQDAGNAGVVVLPGANNLLFAGGTKYLKGHLMNATNMGKFAGGTVDTCLQTISIAASNPVGQEPVAWNSGTPLIGFIYVWPIGSSILQYSYSNTAVAQFETQALTAGGSLTLSANGKTNGILWAVGNDQTVYSFLAADISNKLWNSAQSAADALPSLPGHFQFPAVANGKLYVPVSTNQLVAYGLLAPTQVALVFTTQPLSAIGGTILLQNQVFGDFQVSVVDAAGNVVPSAYSVTITVPGTFANPPVVNGVLTQPCVNGVATFTGISFQTLGTYTLQANTPTLQPALSNSFLITTILPAASNTAANNNNNVAPVTSTTTPTTTIIGAAVGGAFGLICCIGLIIGAFIFYREKKVRDEDKNYVYNPNIHLTTPGEMQPIPTMPLEDIQRFRMDTVRE